MGGRQIVLVSTAGFSVLNTGVFWWEAKTKRPFSQCIAEANMCDCGGMLLMPANIEDITYIPPWIEEKPWREAQGDVHPMDNDNRFSAFVHR
jgi:hypothetical protein